MQIGYDEEAIPPRDDKPCFLQVSLNHLHEPFHVLQKYWNLYEGVDIPVPEFPRNLGAVQSTLDRSIRHPRRSRRTPGALQLGHALPAAGLCGHPSAPRRSVADTGRFLRFPQRRNCFRRPVYLRGARSLVGTAGKRHSSLVPRTVTLIPSRRSRFRSTGKPRRHVYVAWVGRVRPRIRRESPRSRRNRNSPRESRDCS